MLNVPKRANDAMHMSMLDGYDVSLSRLFQQCVIFAFPKLLVFLPSVSSVLPVKSQQWKCSPACHIPLIFTRHFKLVSIFYICQGYYVFAFCLSVCQQGNSKSC